MKKSALHNHTYRNLIKPTDKIQVESKQKILENARWKKKKDVKTDYVVNSATFNQVSVIILISEIK